MGHDISAYVKTKDDNNETEVSYFRIGAFNTQRQRLFYGTLPRAQDANAGVSGNGDSIIFTRDEIQKAIDACKYYIEDGELLDENLLSHQLKGEESIDMFAEVLSQLTGGKVATAPVTFNNEDSKNNLEDIIKFHETILETYDLTLKNDPTSYIEIYFG